MHLKVVSAGQRLPEWVNSGFEAYRKRFPREMRLELIEVPLAGKAAQGDPAKARRVEGERIMGALRGNEFVIALEVEGRSWSTEKLAEQLENWQMSGRDTALLIGGPEGLAPACRERADQSWSVSPLTLPHPLVRVLVAEQLYRAWTITRNHPYHRAG